MTDYILRPVLNDFVALDELASRIVMDERVGDHHDWFLLFRQGLHGMLARWEIVAQNYNLVHEWEKRRRSMFGARIEIEVHTSAILFGMDSAIECYVFTMNALGNSVLPNEFCDVSDAAALRRIGPNNILGGGPNDRRNPVPGYQILFPKSSRFWDSNRDLLHLIMEHHDVNKHRKSSANSWDYRTDPPENFFEEIEKELGEKLDVFGRSDFSPPGKIFMSSSPKLPGSHMSSETYTLESLTQEFHKFIYDLLILTVEDVQENIISVHIP
jgi:hypothetical protein